MSGSYDALLAAVLAICVVTDVKSRKIYNKTLLPAWLAALLLHAVLGGWRGIELSLLGCAAGFGLLLLPYFMGGMGAGDVKLLAFVGAVKGTGFVLLASLCMALVGAVLALIVLLAKRDVRKRAVWYMYWGYSFRCGVSLPLMADKNPGLLHATYPYGVAIAGGTALSWWLRGRGLV